MFKYPSIFFLLSRVRSCTKNHTSEVPMIHDFQVELEAFQTSFGTRAGHSACLCSSHLASCNPIMLIG